MFMGLCMCYGIIVERGGGRRGSVMLCYVVSLVKQKMVKAKMQTATLARHSCMKTSSDEQKAREKRRQAQDSASAKS